MSISDETLDKLMALSRACDPPPWIASVEGRDHMSGDSFIQIGRDGYREEDIYISRESGLADARYLDLIAAAVTHLPVLVEEVRRLRSRIASHETGDSENGGTGDHE